MKNSRVPKSLITEVRSSNRCLILGHRGADGDVAGGCLALKALMESLGKEVVVYNAEPLPQKLTFLPGAEEWMTQPPEGRFDVTLIIDAANYERCGLDIFQDGTLGTIIWIDHHKDTSPPVDIKYIDLDAPAAGEMVLHIADALGVSLNKHTAQCALAALMTDTGGFRYRSASVRAFESAARLVAAGAQPHEIAMGFYENRSLLKSHLISDVLAQVEMGCKGRFAWSCLVAEDFGFATLTKAQTHGLVNEIRSIQGVQLACLLVQNDGGTHVIIRDKDEGQSRKLAAFLGYPEYGRRFSAEWHDPRSAETLAEHLARLV